MRHQNSFRAVIAEVIDGRQAFADSGVISDANFAAANFGRHVEVHAHQHAFSADIEITDRKLRHYFTPTPTPTPTSAPAPAHAQSRKVLRLHARTVLVQKISSAFP